MITDLSLYPAVRMGLMQSAPLSPEQQAILRDELATDPAARGYASAHGSDLLALLNDVYEAPNPDPQGRVPILTIPRADFATALATFVAKVGALPASNPYRAAILAQYQLLMPSVALMDFVRTDSQTFVAVFEAVQASGAMSAEEYEQLTTVPDPAYQAVLVMPSRASVLGLGIVEASDMKGLD